MSNDAKPYSDEELAALRDWVATFGEVVKRDTRTSRFLATLAARDAEIVRLAAELAEARGKG